MSIINITSEGAAILQSLPLKTLNQHITLLQGRDRWGGELF